MIKKAITGIVAGSIVVGLPVNAFAAPITESATVNAAQSEVIDQQSSEVINQQSTNVEEQIKQLFDERARLMSEQPEGYMDSYNVLGEQLESLGVDFLTPEQAQARISSLNKSGSITTQVAVPVQSNIIWSSFRNRFVKNGVEYEVQHLAAEPNSSNSSLKANGAVVLSSNSTWQAGVQGLIKTAAYEGVSQLSGGVGIALTVYDAMSAFVKDSNFSKTTEVTSIKANYTYSYIQNVDFMYVKRVGQADTSQTLAYVSTGVNGTIGWQLPTFSYKANGAIKSTGIGSGSKSFSYAGANHRNGSAAVNNFVAGNTKGGSYVDRVAFTGFENKSIKTIYPTKPLGPYAVK